jgi:hypothetical protein
MSANQAAIAIDARPTVSNPLDVIPNEMPFDVPMDGRYHSTGLRR